MVWIGSHLGLGRRLALEQAVAALVAVLGFCARDERVTVMAANRLMLVAVVALVAGSALSLAGVIEPSVLLLGIGSR